MKDRNFQELAELFFDTKQTIRANLPEGPADPNAWMRCETLRFIAKENPTMRQLATYLKITAPSATSLMRKLSSLGWISRKPSEKDRRVVGIALSPRGERELARYRRQAERTMRSVFSKLGARDLAHLKRVLRNLRDIHAD